MNAYEELKQYFETQIKNALLELVANEGGSFTLEVDYNTACNLNDVLQKHGFEVYGMAVRPTELEVTLELSNKYCLQIPNLPIRYCNITLSNDGNYYVDIDESVADEKLWISFNTATNNFSKCSEEEVANFVDEIKKIHLVHLLSN